MKNKTTYVIVAILAIVVIVSWIVFPKPAEVENFAGQTHLSGLAVGASGLTLEDGGDVTLGSGSTFTASGIIKSDGGITQSATFATSSTGAGTLTQANILGVNTILSTNAGALTITMPASSTLTTFIPTAGDRVSMVLINQGTALLTLAGGTGTLLQTASSTKTVNIGGSSLLEFVRKTNTDVVVYMSPGI